MPVNLSVKGVPDELAQRLRDRAAANHRSLQRELVVILEQAVSQAGARAETRAPLEQAAVGRPVEQVIAELRAMFPRTRGGGDASVDLVRRMRDSRHGAPAVKRRGRGPS